MWVWGGDEDGGRPRGRQSQGRIDWQPRWPLPRSSPLQSGEPRNSCNFSHHDNPPSHQKEPQWGFMPPVCFPGLLLCINRTALYMFSCVHCLPCFNIQSMIHPAAERSYCSLQVRACRSHTNPFCWNEHLSYFLCPPPPLETTVLPIRKRKIQTLTTPNTGKNMNRNSHSLLMGMQNGTATVKKGLATSYKYLYTLLL